MLSDNLSGLNDFMISFQKDIILRKSLHSYRIEMLQKSNKVFNFANVSQRLYELYVNHLSRNAQSQVRADLHSLGH